MELKSSLSHIDDAGRARMVDVSAKDETRREATAKGRIVMQPGDAKAAAARAKSPRATC